VPRFWSRLRLSTRSRTWSRFLRTCCRGNHRCRCRGRSKCTTGSWEHKQEFIRQCRSLQNMFMPHWALIGTWGRKKKKEVSLIQYYILNVSEKNQTLASPLPSKSSRRIAAGRGRSRCCCPVGELCSGSFASDRDQSPSMNRDAPPTPTASTWGTNARYPPSMYTHTHTHTRVMQRTDPRSRTYSRKSLKTRSWRESLRESMMRIHGLQQREGHQVMSTGGSV